MAALTRAIVDDGFPLLEGAFLARIEADTFRHILRGNVPIPLEAERFAIWRACGAVLTQDFCGRWHEVVRRAEGSALQLVCLLVGCFLSWNDTAQFKGRQVAFHKRAQLAASMLYQAFAGKGWGTFDDFDQLTVYADYKLPQVLRKLAILEYDGKLATGVDSQIVLPAGSRMEVEIRAATVCSCDLMRQTLLPRMSYLTAAHLDFWLWQRSQKSSPDDRPYHRTRTTAY